jgi:hypothetical protein
MSLSVIKTPSRLIEMGAVTAAWERGRVGGRGEGRQGGGEKLRVSLSRSIILFLSLSLSLSLYIYISLPPFLSLGLGWWDA